METTLCMVVICPVDSCRDIQKHEYGSNCSYISDIHHGDKMTRDICIYTEAPKLNWHWLYGDHFLHVGIYDMYGIVCIEICIVAIVHASPIYSAGRPLAHLVARWAAEWRVERSILLWGNVSSQIHLISPGCPRPNSALTVHKSGLKHRSSIHPIYSACRQKD